MGLDKFRNRIEEAHKPPTYRQLGRMLIGIACSQIAVAALLGNYPLALVILMLALVLNEFNEHERKG